MFVMSGCENFGFPVGHPEYPEISFLYVKSGRGGGVARKLENAA